MFQSSHDYNAFKCHLRDFLVSLKEFAGSDLMLNEREVEMENKKKMEVAAALLIPGMVKPSERPEEDMMD